ncbi:MAG: electron transport complex subunit RsxC [Brevinematia bacterium]
MEKVITKTFKRGGILLEEAKYTEEKPIEKTHYPKIVRIPLSQHTGAPAKLLVKEGDQVNEGDLIGEAVGFISANVHSSVSGKVISIKKGNTFTQKNVDIVEIESGGTIRNWYERKKDYSNWGKKDFLEAIKNAGIVGLGGAAFPTHVKLSPPEGKKIDLLIVNGAECEPYLTIDHRMMLEKAKEIIEGIKIILNILSIKNAIIAIEENKLDAYQAFSELLVSEPEIKLELLKTKYPQGGEKQIIQAITKKEVPSGGLPMDVKIVVENVSTVYAIYEAVAYGKPLIERGITYTGENLTNAGNYKVRIGTPVQSLIEEFGTPPDFDYIIAGGPMMGIEITDTSMPIMKGTSGIVFLPKSKTYEVKNYPCIRCGRCVTVCPIGLQPTEIASYCDNFMVEDAFNIGLMDCIECGCCAYSCPSSIPLVGLIRYGKEFYRRKYAKK